ncbi:predicted protein [Chaetoceros tenuissimus]|uniref:Uncharacterized protein n=1 Tax=Chaetoceros tenuissimus TaxID=426638 RepID=A0AAD3CWY1_9STRA|nr:predicted protein [Chaetoceros tenuissimus]
MGVEASANVDIQKKNNLSMDSRYRDYLKHDYPNNISRMLKYRPRSNGSGGGKCDKACGITMGIVYGSLLGIVIMILIISRYIYPFYLSKRFKAKLIRARNKFFVEDDKSTKISFPLKHHNVQESPWIQKTNTTDEECDDRKSKPVPISGNYAVTYSENENEFVSVRGTLHADFTEAHNGKGYKVSGSFEDEHGFAIIKEGFVNYDGTAYWYEFYECPSTSLRCNLKHLEVLNEGTFNFRNNSFTNNCFGTWESNTGLQGKILSLEQLR